MIKDEKPAVTAAMWSPQELRGLVDLVKQHGRDFKTIAEKLQTRSMKACRDKANMILELMIKGEIPSDSKFKSQLGAANTKSNFLFSGTGEGGKREQHEWPISEISFLIALVKANGRNWTKISEQIKTRTRKACFSKVNLLVDMMKSGRMPLDQEFLEKFQSYEGSGTTWQKVASADFFALLKEHGLNFKLVAAKMGEHRSEQSCRKHFRKYRDKMQEGKVPFDPELQKLFDQDIPADSSKAFMMSYWTEQEVDKLIELVRVHGRDFGKVSLNLGSGRSLQAVQSRAAKLLKQMTSGEIPMDEQFQLKMHTSVAEQHKLEKEAMKREQKEQDKQMKMEAKEAAMKSEPPKVPSEWHSKLIELVKEHGKDFTKVSEMTGDKNPIQCKFAAYLVQRRMKEEKIQRDELFIQQMSKESVSAIEKCDDFIQLLREHGRDWKKIAEKYGREPKYCRSKAFRIMQQVRDGKREGAKDLLSTMGEYSHGIWNMEEVAEYVKLVKQHGEDYQAIADKLQTKDFKQCRQKRYTLSKQMQEGRYPLDQEFLNVLHERLPIKSDDIKIPDVITGDAENPETGEDWDNPTEEESKDPVAKSVKEFIVCVKKIGKDFAKISQTLNRPKQWCYSMAKKIIQKMETGRMAIDTVLYDKLKQQTFNNGLGLNLWTDEEQIKLIQLVKENGKDWKTIEASMGTRSATAIALASAKVKKQMLKGCMPIDQDFLDKMSNELDTLKGIFDQEEDQNSNPQDDTYKNMDPEVEKFERYRQKICEPIKRRMLSKNLAIQSNQQPEELTGQVLSGQSMADPLNIDISQGQAPPMVDQQPTYGDQMPDGGFPGALPASEVADQVSSTLAQNGQLGGPPKDQIEELQNEIEHKRLMLERLKQNEMAQQAAANQQQVQAAQAQQYHQAQQYSQMYVAYAGTPYEQVYAMPYGGYQQQMPPQYPPSQQIGGGLQSQHQEPQLQDQQHSGQQLQMPQQAPQQQPLQQYQDTVQPAQQTNAPGQIQLPAAETMPAQAAGVPPQMMQFRHRQTQQLQHQPHLKAMQQPSQIGIGAHQVGGQLQQLAQPHQQMEQAHIGGGAQPAQVGFEAPQTPQQLNEYMRQHPQQYPQIYGNYQQTSSPQQL